MFTRTKLVAALLVFAAVLTFLAMPTPSAANPGPCGKCSEDQLCTYDSKCYSAGAVVNNKT
jgi:hypothetical protein